MDEIRQLIDNFLKSRDWTLNGEVYCKTQYATVNGVPHPIRTLEFKLIEGEGSIDDRTVIGYRLTGGGVLEDIWVANISDFEAMYSTIFQTHVRHSCTEL